MLKRDRGKKSNKNWFVGIKLLSFYSRSTTQLCLLHQSTEKKRKNKRLFIGRSFFKYSTHKLLARRFLYNQVSFMNYALNKYIMKIVTWKSSMRLILWKASSPSESYGEILNWLQEKVLDVAINKLFFFSRIIPDYYMYQFIRDKQRK